MSRSRKETIEREEDAIDQMNWRSGLYKIHLVYLLP